MIPDPARQRLRQAQALAEPVPVWLGRWLLPLLVGLAGVSGLLSDAIGPGHHVNLLAPPLLALLVWNAGVLLWLLVGGLRRSPCLTRALARRLAPAGTDTALLEARLGMALHLAAVVVAAGALAAMYLRGLGLEYRAGWDSTFLDAQAVHRWLNLLLGPASALSGIALPGPAQLEALRFSTGPGENAARWIHLYALTTGGLVILPRAGLAAWSAWTAARLRQAAAQPQAAMPPAPTTAPQQVAVLPCGYLLPAERHPALASAIQAHFGPLSACHRAANVPLGSDDSLDPVWAAATQTSPAPDLLVLLMPLSATPERETHGAFVRAIQARCQARQPPLRCVVMLDESGFRARLAAADLAPRLGQRRAAWQQLLAGTGLAPGFVDLQPPPGPTPSTPSGRSTR